MEHHRFLSQWFTIRDTVTTHTLFYRKISFQQRRLKSKPTFKTIKYVKKQGLKQKYIFNDVPAIWWWQFEQI